MSCFSSVGSSTAMKNVGAVVKVERIFLEVRVKGDEKMNQFVKVRMPSSQTNIAGGRSSEQQVLTLEIIC